MGMMDLLYHTYEYAYEAKDAELIENYQMAQISATAPIEVWITENGEFAGASYISDKNRQKISIPCTEKSDGRSGTDPFPHPLFDKLSYLAGDGGAYQVDNQKAHDTYMQNLRMWCGSKHGNPYVKTVLCYLEKNTLLHDLVRTGILVEPKSKEFDKRLKEVVRLGIRRDLQTDLELWREKSIQEDFRNYLAQSQREKDFCYFSGKMETISVNHPRSIWNQKANAKLISANEDVNRGFVFSGRFETANQAAQISYEASQKIHNALKWLIHKQGIPIGDKILIAWGVDGSNQEDMFGSTDGFLGKDEDEGEKEAVADTQVEFAQRLKKAIYGKEQDLGHNEKIAFLVLEAATTGRLSVSYYQEYGFIQYAQLMKTVERWHFAHSWKYDWYDARKGVWKSRIMAPSIFDIAEFAEGVERDVKGGKVKGDGKKKKIESNEKILGNTIVRLLPCVLEGRAVPEDISRKLLAKACHPLYYSEANWNKLLKITCSVIRTKYKEVGSMEINKDSIDIPYNYGRWLACAHEIERRALRSASEKRETNAMRLFTKYAEHPNKYMAIVQSKIQVYETKLGQKAYWLQNEKYRISQQLNQNPLEKLVAARHLDGRMILGFEAQMETFQKKEEKEAAAGGEANERIEEQN